jgi:hypothetical protein
MALWLRSYREVVLEGELKAWIFATWQAQKKRSAWTRADVRTTSR